MQVRFQVLPSRPKAGTKPGSGSGRGSGRGAGAAVVISGRVDRVFRSSPGWAAGRMVLESASGGFSAGESVPFVGACMVQPDDHVRLTGAWKDDPRFGIQLAVASFEYAVPVDPGGIAAYIAKNPRIKGIGPAKAAKLVATFGARWEEALEQDVEHMMIVAGAHRDVIEGLRDEWRRTAVYNQAAAKLASYGLTHHQIQILAGKWGNSVICVLETDPYLMIREIKGLGFKKVDVIARRIGTDKNHPSRLRAGLLEVLGDEARSGHTWTSAEELLHKANAMLILDGLDARERIGVALEQAIADGLFVAEESPATGRRAIGLPMLRDQERTIHEFLARARACAPILAPGASLSQERGALLTRGQAKALELAARSRIMVLTGGAGTGKTYTVNAVCDLYATHAPGRRIQLCAPTGKAAKRMEESTGRPAMTIHRMLDYDGRAFRRSDMIDAALLVVDEVSMMDAPLFAELIERIDLDETALLLVGDHNQLPPVGPGNVLRDMILHALVPVAHLDQVVRQAGILKANSVAILRGFVAPSAPQPEDGGLRPWQVINDLGDIDELLDLLTALYGGALHEKYGMDPVRDVQVLSPQRKGPLGVNELNILLQRIVQHTVFGRDVVPTPDGKRPKFHPGDKIIQRRNNYDLGLMNGAVGIVREVRSNGDVAAEFDCEEVLFESGEGHLNEVDLAYALTIHQTQGSEFPVALVICHKAQSYMHHRNLLYTAVTRAKLACAILGDAYSIRECARTEHVAGRRTWIGLWESDGAARAADAALSEKAQETAQAPGAPQAEDEDDIPF